MSADQNVVNTGIEEGAGAFGGGRGTLRDQTLDQGWKRLICRISKLAAELRSRLDANGLNKGIVEVS